MMVSSFLTICLLQFGQSAAFLTPRPARFSALSATESSSTTTTSRPATVDSEDVDARVLQSLLQDNKLDANDVQRVMEQKKQQQVATSSAALESNEEESQYSSQLLQKLSDTKLFRKLSVQASEFLETTQLLVFNSLEQNLAVVLAMTSTIWDRATQNVARALPATRTKTNTTTTRLLTSAAPAGRAGAATRAQRAYTAAKQNAKPKAPNVVNAAYQVRKELQAETSTPGYKTEPARQALAAAAVSAYRIAGLAVPSLLKGAAKPNALAAEGGNNATQEQRSDEPMTNAASSFADTVDSVAAVIDTEDAVVVESFSVSSDIEDELFATTIEEEDDDVMLRQRLEACISDPQATWLTPDVAQALPQIDYCVQEAVTLLTRTRASKTPLERSALQQVCTDISGRTSKVVGDAVQEYLLQAHTEPVATSTTAVVEEVVIVAKEEEPIMVIADAQVENYVQQTTIVTEVIEDDDASYTSVATAVVEVVTDEDGVMSSEDDLPNNVRHVEDEPVAKEPNVLSTLALRSLDVLFLLVEKIVVVGVPRTITLGKTAIKRIEGVKRQGQGTEGWTPVSTVKGRY